MNDWFNLNWDKKKLHILIYAVIAFVFYGIGKSLTDWDTIGFFTGLAVFLILEFRLEIKREAPVLIRAILLCGMAFLIFIIMQMTISCGVLLIGIVKFAMNIILVGGLIALFWLITGKLKAAAIIVTVFTQILAVANHLVVQARSFEIQFSDFFSLGTAAGVADQYAFELSDRTLLGIIWAVVFIFLLAKTKFPHRERTWKTTACSAVCALIALGFVGIIYSQFASGFIAYQDKYWKYRGSERNGFFVNMVYSASATRIIKPEGYNTDTLAEKTQDYIRENDGENGEKKRPNVIVIMNETFSDVHHIAEFMGGYIPSDIQLTPFLDSLSDEDPNIIKGHALSSVYGGNTANSELEFLTGLSIQFIPRNTVAYNLYIQEDNSFTIVNSFNEAGYKTVSIHPENPTNWQRKYIYEYFNFDTTVFKDDFASIPDEDYYRGHVSDAAVYDKIIDLYENMEGDQPLFTFAITMQNHSGYSTPGFEYTVDMAEKNGYFGIREYLSAINNSDAAFKELVEYFEKQDEETIIVFFGDHQPSLANIAQKFYGVEDEDPTLLQESKYVVPYVFWANYEIDCERATPFTSINFLSSWLREMVDLPETPFNKFVDCVNRDVMAINAMGWFDHDFNFHESDYSNPNLSDPLKLYSHLQYNMLFDKEEKITELFSLPKE